MEKNRTIEKIERLNLILNAFRDVGRLLLSENDRGKLIKGICDILVARLGYYNAWIGLFDGENKVVLADSGVNPRFEPIKELEIQEFFRCIQESMAADRITRMEADFRYYPFAEIQEDAALRWALISAPKIDYLGVESVLTNILVTNSMEVQRFLRIQDKMTSLGRVTAEIAHKIESIIKRVMDFSKPGQPQFVMTDLNHYIDEVTKLTAMTLRKNEIRLVKKLDPHFPTVQNI